FRRIARDRQFGEGHDVRPKRLGFFEPLDDFPGVPFEVTDGGVDLGHGDPEPRRHLAPPGGGGLHPAAPGAAQRLLPYIITPAVTPASSVGGPASRRSPRRSWHSQVEPLDVRPLKRRGPAPAPRRR